MKLPLSDTRNLYTLFSGLDSLQTLAVSFSEPFEFSDVLGLVGSVGQTLKALTVRTRYKHEGVIWEYITRPSKDIVSRQCCSEWW